MTSVSVVSEVVYEDILLFKCQSFNYANGLQGACVNVQPPCLVCTMPYILRVNKDSQPLFQIDTI